MDLSPPTPPLLPPPPGFHHPNNTSFPVTAIAVIGILATAFLLISYYIFVIKCCLTWHRVDIFNRFFSRVRDPSDELDSSPMNPLAHDSNAEKGLDEALIRSIPVIEFRKLKKERQFNNNINTTTARDHRAVVVDEENNKNVESYECAVCLSEFEEGERLRVIPYCCHGFHIDCIDVWLQSNANCPLCRSGISPASILCNTQQHLVSFPPSSNPQSHHHKVETNGSDNDNDSVNESDYDDNDDDDDDYVVIEIKGNNLDEPRLVRRDSEERKNKGRKKLKHVYSMGDELIDMRNNKDDDEFHNIQPIRRSISMDLSTQRDFCIEIQQCCRNNNNDNIIMQESEQSCCSSSSSNNSKVRRLMFSFGYGRSSRCSVQPVHLDP